MRRHVNWIRKNVHRAKKSKCLNIPDMAARCMLGLRLSGRGPPPPPPGCCGRCAPAPVQNQNQGISTHKSFKNGCVCSAVLGVAHRGGGLGRRAPAELAAPFSRRGRPNRGSTKPVQKSAARPAWSDARISSSAYFTMRYAWSCTDLRPTEHSHAIRLPKLAQRQW